MPTKWESTLISWWYQNTYALFSLRTGNVRLIANSCLPPGKVMDTLTNYCWYIHNHICCVISFHFDHFRVKYGPIHWKKWTEISRNVDDGNWTVHVRNARGILVGKVHYRERFLCNKCMFFYSPPLPIKVTIMPLLIKIQCSWPPSSKSNFLWTPLPPKSKYIATLLPLNFNRLPAHDRPHLFLE